MKLLIVALCVMSACGGVSAQKPVWQPSPGHTQIPIWPGAAPDPQPVAGPEYAETSGKDFLSRWEAGSRCEQRDAAYHDGLLAEGEEYRRCDDSVSWRGLSESCH